MAEQTIQLLASWYEISGTTRRWVAPFNSRPQIDSDLTIAGSRFFVVFEVQTGGVISFRLASNQTESSFDLNDDLSLLFEQQGSLEITVGSNSLLVALDHADTAEPYVWTPANSAAAGAFLAMLSDTAGTESGQLIIRDFVPAPVVHDRSASFTLGAPGFSAVVGKTVHTGVSLNTIPVQEGVEYIRVLLTMGAGTPSGGSLNIRAVQSYVTQTGDAQFFDSGSSLILDGIQPHEPGSGTGAVRLRNTGGGFKPWRDAQARTPKLLYASSADGATVRQATEGTVGGGYWNWFITGLPSSAQVGVGDTINLVIYVPPEPVVLRDIATGFTIGAPSFSAVVGKTLPQVHDGAASFALGAPSFSAVLGKFDVSLHELVAGFGLGAPAFGVALGKTTLAAHNRAAAFALGAPAFAAVLGKTIVSANDRAASFALGVPSFSAVLGKRDVSDQDRAVAFALGVPLFSAALGKRAIAAHDSAAAFSLGAPSFAAVVGKTAVGVTQPPGSGVITSYIGGTIHPIETASLQITRRVGERPISECDLFFRDITTFRRPRRGEQLEIHESALPLALSAAENYPILSLGGEALLSLGGEAVLSLGGHQVLDPAIASTLLFGGTVLDSQIILTHNDLIGRCIVTGTGYAALLDITIKERYATVHGATCAEVIIALLTRYASGLGLTFSTASIVASNICPDLIFGYQFLSQALTLVADAGNVVWAVNERGVFTARSRDHLVRFDQTTRGAGFTVREGVNGTVARILHKEDPTNFANEVTVIGSAPQISTSRDVFTGDGATTSWPLTYQADSVTDVDVVDASGSVQDVDSFGGDGDAWQVDTSQARIMQRTGDTALAVGWKVRVTYNFHLPVIYTARDQASIDTYKLVCAVPEEDPELDTIESVSQRATSKLRRHTAPTQILDLLLLPGTSGPFEGHGVPVVLPRHGIHNEIWLVEEIEIEELESQLLQWRITLLQRDHESLYAQAVKPRRIQPSEPANIGAIPGIRTILTDATRIGSESDLFSAFLGGSHAERITSNLWTDIPGSAVAQLHGAVFGTSAIQWIVTAKLVQPTNGPAVTAAVRLYNRTTAMARGSVVGVTSPHADFHGSTRLALDDSLNRYVLQGRIVERDISQDPNFAAGLYSWAGEFVKPR